LRAIRILALLTAVLTFGLIVLGALVRSTNSGLSCPDWPTCYGYWVLTLQTFATLPDTGYTYGQVMLEWTHRLIAGVFLGPLILILALVTFVRGRRTRGLAPAGAVMLLLLLVQAGLGGVTVLDGNSPWSVALHLGTALLLLTTILFLYVRAGEEGSPRSHWVGRVALVTWACTLLAMLAAAVTSKSGAALACSTWPLCNGLVVPDLADPLIRIHMTHRLLAALSGVAVLVLVAVSWRTAYRGQALFALLLILAEIGLGAAVIIHAVIAGLMWRAARRAGPRMAPTIGELDGLALRSA
jgi:cytochrome c oxidase assembly protein subunit 15